MVRGPSASPTSTSSTYKESASGCFQALRIFPTLISNRSKSEATSAAAAAAAGGCCGGTTASVSTEETADDDEEHDKAVEKENKTGLELIILLPAAAAAAYSTLFFHPKEETTNTGLITHADVVMLRPALDSTLAPTIAIATAAGRKRGQCSKAWERGRRERRRETRLEKQMMEPWLGNLTKIS